MNFSHEVKWIDHLGDAPDLPMGAAHLWDLQNAMGTLTFSEREHWSKISNAEARQGFLQSRGGLRQVVSRYLSCPDAKVSFRHHEHGKPYVEGAPEFNLSHTQGRAFVAFAAQPVGLDVESRDRRVNARALAARFFSPSEAALIHQSSETAPQNVLFLRHWVCKEAMVKLSGDGIYHGLKDAEVDFRGGCRGRYRGREVWLWEFSPAPDLMGALASWEPLEVKGFLRL